MADRHSSDRENEDCEWNARAIARRNRASVGKPLSPVMKTAATARELAHGPAAEDGRREPPRKTGDSI